MASPTAAAKVGNSSPLSSAASPTVATVATAAAADMGILSPAMDAAATPVLYPDAHFVLPERKKDKYFWSQLVLRPVPASGTRREGTVTLHAGGDGIPVNSYLPCVGRFTACKPEVAAAVSTFRQDVLSVHGGLLDGSMLADPVTDAVRVLSGVFAQAVHPAVVGCGGLSLFPYVREPPQHGGLRVKAVLKPLSPGWRVDPRFLPLAEWEAKQAFDDPVTVGAVLHVMDNVGPEEEITALVNGFDSSGRRSEYAAPCPMLMADPGVLRAFVDVTGLSRGTTFRDMHYVLGAAENERVAPAYALALNRHAPGASAETVAETATIALRYLTAALVTYYEKSRFPPLPPLSVLGFAVPAAPLAAGPAFVSRSAAVIRGNTPLKAGGAVGGGAGGTPTAKRARQDGSGNGGMHDSLAADPSWMTDADLLGGASLMPFGGGMGGLGGLSVLGGPAAMSKP